MSEQSPDQDADMPTAEPAGSDAAPDTGEAAAEKDEQDQPDQQAPPPGYADFEPTTTPG